MKYWNIEILYLEYIYREDYLGFSRSLGDVASLTAPKAVCLARDLAVAVLPAFTT